MIRSKGIGIYFVTQNPLDVPDRVLGQLGNRVQHALRAFTPRDQKAVKVAAQTFRANPNLDIETVITELGVGEALVSCLDEKGTPGITERALILPPHSQIGAISPEQRTAIIQGSLITGIYEASVDRESAYEMLKAQAMGAAQSAEQIRLEREAEAAQKKAEADLKKAEAAEKRAEADQKKVEAEAKRMEAAQARAAAQAARQEERRLKELAREQERLRKEAERAARNNPFNQILGNVANTAGREITRGLFGNIFGSSRRRR